MKNIIDARGRSCPEPVVMTKQGIDKYKGEDFQVLVDSKVAVENVRRFAVNKGYNVNIDENGEDFSLKITR